MRGAGAWVVVAAALAAPSARAAEWPETREGKLASGWVAAFSAGEPAMRQYWLDNLAASSLAAHSMEERLKSYRDLRDRLGTLRLVEVVDAATPGELTVTLADEDDEENEFTFRVETAEPRKLVGVTARLTRHHGFGGFPHGG